MTERERVERILKELALPAGHYVVAGSAVMILHEIERSKPMGDLDIFIATAHWFSLYEEDDPATNLRKWKLFVTDPADSKRRVDPPYLYRDMYGLEVNIFSGWRRRSIGDIDVAFWIHNAENVQGWPCVPLQLILDWKEAVGRAKDVDDIQALQEHLQT